jgi:ferrous iron transport protein B
MADCHTGPAILTPEAPDTSALRHVVAIIGPPNAGKSTLFNRLTGLRQKVANFPGVTVEHHMGKVRVDGDRDVYAIDLPGIYSLQPRTDDERVTHDVLMGKMPDMPRPDAVLLVLDATNLARHLVLAAPVLGIGLPTLVVLNMADDLERRGGSLNVKALAAQLGAPVVMTSAQRGDGLDKVTQFLAGTTLVSAPT